MRTRRYIQYALLNRHNLEERRYYGDYGACDALMDLDDAIERARLSRKQRDVLQLLYDRDMKRIDVASVLDTTSASITFHNNRAISLIASAYEGSDEYC